MSNGAPSIPNPVGQLVEIHREVVETFPNVEEDRRRIALKWLDELSSAVKDWNEGFVGVLTTYPGRSGSGDVATYRTFFENMQVYETALLTGDKEVKRNLSGRLRHLNTRFYEDFAWLKRQNPRRFDSLEKQLKGAYENEMGVIGKAMEVMNRVRMPTDPAWHVANHAQVAALIDDYARDSKAAVEKIRQIRDDADQEHTPIDDVEARRNPSSAPPPKKTKTTTTLTSNAPQIKHEHVYRLLAWGSGVGGMLLLVIIALFVPQPEPFQRQIFIVVLSLTAGAFATVITGLLDVKAALGKQLSIGAAGAFGVFVLVYFFLPAGG